MSEVALQQGPAQQGAIQPTAIATGSELQAAMQFAQALAQSNMLPAQYRGRPANVLWAIEFGKAVGIEPMAAILGVHMIDGKPSASAGLISGLVRRAGHRLRVFGNDTTAVCEIVRSDDPEYTFRAEWNLDRARQAGLTEKTNWRQYPAAMLKARAITEAARDACEEVLFGLHYTPEELGATVDADGQVIAQPDPPGQRTDVQVSAPLQVAQPSWDATVRAAQQAASSDDPKAIRGLYVGLPKLSREVDVSQAVPPAWRSVVLPFEAKIGAEGPLALKWWLWGCMTFVAEQGLSVAEAAFHAENPAAPEAADPADALPDVAAEDEREIVELALPLDDETPASS